MIKMEEKQDNVLDPEVIARINSYDAPEELKSDFREILKSIDSYHQIFILISMEKIYQDILQKLVETLDNKNISFNYEYGGSGYDNFKYKEKFLKCYREVHKYDAQTYDCFIKHMSKIDMYKNIKFDAKKIKKKWKLLIV